jgi:hypothetical protein
MHTIKAFIEHVQNDEYRYLMTDSPTARHWPLVLAEACVEQLGLALAGSGRLEDSFGAEPAVFLLEYVDGFRAALLHSRGEGATVSGWAYAARHSADGLI